MLSIIRESMSQSCKYKIEVIQRGFKVLISMAMGTQPRKGFPVESRIPWKLRR